MTRYFVAGPLFLFAWAALAGEDEKHGANAPQAGDAKQIAALEKALSNATLVGHFTVTGEDAKGDLSEERYELGKVRHLGDDQWLFEARIKYGDHDVKLPLTLPVYWAGDTPVITVDNVPIIGLGTFDARVMIHRDHYAGFWSGGSGDDKHGGHLFGLVKQPNKD